MKAAGARRPPSSSTNTSSLPHSPGITLRSALDIAVAVAAAIPSRSTTRGPTIETTWRSSSFFRIHEKRFSRFPTVNFLESRIPFAKYSCSIGVSTRASTAPTTSGPATGPRPASSIPTTYCARTTQFYHVPRRICAEYSLCYTPTPVFLACTKCTALPF